MGRLDGEPVMRGKLTTLIYLLRGLPQFLRLLADEARRARGPQ